MRTKTVLIFTLPAIGILFLIKLYCDGNRRSAPPINDASPKMEQRMASEFPIGYTLGTFDTRFGIDRDRFLQIVEQAKNLWEYAADRDLFEYRQDAALKINLIYDWRQEQFLKTKERKSRLDESGKSFDQLRIEYEDRSKSVERDRLAFEESAEVYKSRLSDYNSRLERWNRGENRTQTEYRDLHIRRNELEEEGGELEKKRIELSRSIEELNALAGRINALAAEYNLEVQELNGKFVVMREFEKGRFDGRAINIYEFEKEEDLKITLVHEFGHALALDHIENPKAIMHRLLGAQDKSDIRLTSDDLELLAARFR